MTSLFQVLAHDDSDKQVRHRKALALANTRVQERFARFTAGAENGDDFWSRVDLIRDDLKSVVTAACHEQGITDEGYILTVAVSACEAGLMPGENSTMKPMERVARARRVEARKPKMCPYHSEVVDISLAQGEPSAGFNAMAQHAWGDKHCQGGFEDRCNFKPAMTTQTYWDEKSEKAEERKREREEQAELQAQQEADQAAQEIDVPENTDVSETAETADFAEDGPEMTEVSEGGEAQAEVPMSMAASVPKEAGPGWSEKRERQYKHIKAQCLADGGSEEDCERMAAATVNKTRAEHGETKSHTADVAPPGIPLSDESMDFNRRAQELIAQGVDPVRAFNIAHKEITGLAAPSYGPRTADVEKGPNVTEGPGTPEPKMDKRKWTPQTVPHIDADDDNGPHPSRMKDITEPMRLRNDSERNEIGESVTERQDVTRDGGPSHAGQGGTFPKGNQANPVTSHVLDSKTANAIIAKYRGE